MRHARLLFGVLTLVAFSFFFIGVPFSVASTDSCACYCTGKTGAERYPNETTEVTSETCYAACTGNGKEVAAFACSANEHPSRSANCFTQAQCEEHNGTLDTGYQPPECPTDYFYCYPKVSTSSTIELSTPIGDLISTSDFGEYISAAYRWMLGASTTIAIVFLMIAGLRWALGGSSPDQIAQAKRMIKNAITGLVLLLSVYLVLYVINPGLLTLKVPRFPLIKQVSLVDNASCDELIAEGYDVDYSGPEECGTVGTVKTDPDGNAVADGIVCNFSSCPDSMQLCVPGDTPTCMKCEDLSWNNSVLIPSESICSAFNELSSYNQSGMDGTYTYTRPDGTTQTYKEFMVYSWNYCFYSHDGDAGGTYNTGACARVALDCGAVDRCSGYDKVPVYTSKGTVELDDIDVGAESGIITSTTGVTEHLYETGITLGSFCSLGVYNDLCKWNRLDNDSTCRIDSRVTDVIPGGTSGEFKIWELGGYDCEEDN